MPGKEGSDFYIHEILEGDPKPNPQFAGQRLIEIDTGRVFEWTGQVNKGTDDEQNGFWRTIFNLDSRSDERWHNVLGEQYAMYADVVTIDADTSYFYGFVTGDEDVAFEVTRIITDSSLTTINYYEGGSFSGGTPMQTVNLNRNFPGDISMLNLDQGVTIDVPGTLILSRPMIGAIGVGNSTIVTTNELIGQTIFPENSTFYFELVNNDADALYDFSIKISDEYG